MPTAATFTRSRSGAATGCGSNARNNLDKARRIFERTHNNRPRIQLTIRQRMRVLRRMAAAFNYPDWRDICLARPEEVFGRRSSRLSWGQYHGSRCFGPFAKHPASDHRSSFSWPGPPALA
jgi:hypothetical protein